MNQKEERVGAWIVGAAGNVAVCTVAGLAALRRGLFPPTGMLTESEPFASMGFARWSAWSIGGHEVRSRRVDETAAALATERVLGEGVPRAVAEDLERYQSEIQRGVSGHGGAEEFARVRADLDAFRRRHDLARVVVLNLATTESPSEIAAPVEPEAFLAALAANQLGLPASTIYAAAALDLGMGYVNFTPSRGSDVAALHALAALRGAAHAGSDGKTGETLVKTALAPMFEIRRLRVTSWFGQNVLGNTDGEALADQGRRASKQHTKRAALAEILGYEPESDVGIAYLKAFGDWKVAWDHIAFEGFGGARMSMQFVWQGCDSALAAPLCLDLLRFVERALKRGERGVLPYLALFFKAPMGTREHRLGEQYRLLLSHLERRTA